VGSLRPGDATLYVFVSAVNREVAFRVAREALERVKHEVPIFKLERWTQLKTDMLSFDV